MNPKRNIPVLLLSKDGTHEEVYPSIATDPELGYATKNPGIICWRQNFDSFSVIIAHRNISLNIPNAPIFPNNIWTVYAIIYENHVIYKAMDKLGEDEFGGIGYVFPMYGGVTLFEKAKKLNKRKYHRVGCDFAHGNNELEMKTDVISNETPMVEEANRLIALLLNHPIPVNDELPVAKSIPMVRRLSLE